MPSFRTSAAPYAVAVASVVLAIAVRLLLGPWIGYDFPFATVFLAIIVTAWFGGLRPALVAVALGLIGSNYFLLSPRFAWSLAYGQPVGLALYSIVGLGVAWFGGAMHAARREAYEQMQQALHREQQLQTEMALRAQAQQQTEKAQHQLEEQSERLRVTLGSIGDAVIATDPAGRIVFMNGVAESLTGWTLHDAKEKHLDQVFRILNETTRQPVESPVATVLREGKVVGLASHTVLIARDGAQRPIDDSAAPIRDAAGNLMGVVLVFRDVAERRQVEEVRARLAAIVNSSDDAIISKNFGGIITSWNAGAEKLYGYTAQEIVGRPFSVLVPPDIPSEVPEVLEKIRQAKPIDYYEAIRVTKDGRRILVSARISALRNEAGDVVGASVIARDVTDRDRAEKLRNARLAVIQILAHAPTVEEAIPQIVAAICESLQWDVGNYWEVDEEAVLIFCRSSWNRTGVKVEEFQQASRGLSFRLQESLPGRVWAAGKPCWIPDVVHHEAFVRAAAAQRAGLHGAFALPVHVGERVFGVLEFFSQEIRQPDADLLETAESLGWQLGQFIERQRAERLLRQSEQALSDFFENATIGLHWIGPDGIITRVNQEELDLLGYSREEYVGRHIAEFHVDQHVIADILNRLAGGERLQDYPARMRAKDGSILDVLIDSSVMWKKGKFVHSRCFLRDVTARKHGEALLQFLADASATLTSLVDYHSTLQKVAHLSVPSFADCCMIDMLNDQGQLERVAVAHVNPARLPVARELGERRPHEPNASAGVWHILRTGASELIPEMSEDVIAEMVSEEEPRTLVRQLAPQSYLGVPLQTRGKTIGVITFLTTESGRRFTVDEVKIAQDLASRAAIAIENSRLYAELREAGRRKDEFLAMLAHELRNPLAPLRNGLEIMELVHDDPEALAEARQIMQRQLDQMVRLVDDLLDISRITRGKLELRQERVDLATVIHTAVETSRPLIEAGRHSLSVSLPEEPIELQADVTRLAQVFANLLNNSAKYTPPGGRVDLAAWREGNQVVVSVSDTGIGISPAMLPQVFEMFTQVDGSLERAQGGLGIGLTLVRRLVEMHGGSVEARSAGAGQGSTFLVRLPIASSAGVETAEASAVHVSDGLSRRRILVVDDNRDAANTLSMMLRLMGNEIETAFDGAAALETARQFRPDLIVLDIGLPKMSGYDVARQVRSQPWGRDLILIALTGWGQEEDRRRSQQAGFDYHFVKPIDIVDLKRVLNGVSTGAPAATESQAE